MITGWQGFVGLVCWAVPLQAQIGLASSGQPVTLVAIKIATLSVAVSDGGSDAGPIRVRTAWRLEPSRTAAMNLLASVTQSAAPVFIPRTPAGGPKQVTGGAPTVFTHALTGAAPTGSRLDTVQVVAAAGGLAPVLTLAVLTQ